MHDSRRYGRKNTFLTAYATVDAAQASVPCLVRDLSQRGARITVAGADRMPRTFDLHINGRDHVLRVETVWQTSTEAGVRLLAKRPVEASDRDLLGDETSEHLETRSRSSA